MRSKDLYFFTKFSEWSAKVSGVKPFYKFVKAPYGPPQNIPTPFIFEEWISAYKFDAKAPPEKPEIVNESGSAPRLGSLR